MPEWLAQLANDLQGAPPAAFSRFLPPAGGGRKASAVLILIAPPVATTSGHDAPSGWGPREAAAIDALYALPERQVSETVVLTQRAASMRSHAGQVSFPGGGKEAGDDDEIATALREAEEEIGLEATEVSVLMSLPALHIAVSGYDVTPVLAWWHRPSRIYPRQPAEVERVLRVPIADLIDPKRRFQVRHPSGYTGPAFDVQDSTVWGFTAGVLDRLLDAARLTQPWDRTRMRDIG
ncbi:MAG: CoA pyrophosphatase [Ornithinimicrobium sp.]